MFSKTYCIIYHTNCEIEINALKIKAKKKMPDLPVLEREGYKFIGWYLDSKFEKEYNLEKMPKENVELYAKFESITVEEFLKDIDFFTKSVNILQNLQNDYTGVLDFKEVKDNQKRKMKKKSGKKSKENKGE